MQGEGSVSHKRRPQSFLQYIVGKGKLEELTLPGKIDRKKAKEG